MAEAYMCSRIMRDPLVRQGIAEYQGEFEAEETDGGFTRGTQWLVWKFESDSTLGDAMQVRTCARMRRPGRLCALSFHAGQKHCAAGVIRTCIASFLEEGLKALVHGRMHLFQRRQLASAVSSIWLHHVRSACQVCPSMHKVQGLSKRAKFSQ